MERRKHAGTGYVGRQVEGRFQQRYGVLIAERRAAMAGIPYQLAPWYSGLYGRTCSTVSSMVRRSHRMNRASGESCSSDVRALAQRHGLRTHIDGARLFNAAVALAQAGGGDPVHQAREICDGYDSVSVCLSKGLGAPVGSLLLGSGEFIRQARRVRKMLGGGMRQAGVLAAAGIHALQYHVQQLAEDHANAALLSRGLAEAVAGNARLRENTNVHEAQTNILFMDVGVEVADELMRHLAAAGIRVTSGTQRVKKRTFKRFRWVTHLDVTRVEVERAVQAVVAFSD